MRAFALVLALLALFVDNAGSYSDNSCDGSQEQTETLEQIHDDRKLLQHNQISEGHTLAVEKSVEYSCQQGWQAGHNQLGAFKSGKTYEWCENECSSNQECKSFDTSAEDGGNECYLSSTTAGSGGGVLKPLSKYKYCEKKGAMAAPPKAATCANWCPRRAKKNTWEVLCLNDKCSLCQECTGEATGEATVGVVGEGTGEATGEATVGAVGEGTGGGTGVGAGTVVTTPAPWKDTGCKWRCYLDRYPTVQSFCTLNAAGRTEVDCAAQYYEVNGTVKNHDCTCRSVSFDHCDWQCYLDNYAGLQEYYGKNNVKGAAEHYDQFGYKEGRDCTCQFKITEPGINECPAGFVGIQNPSDCEDAAQLYSSGAKLYGKNWQSFQPGGCFAFVSSPDFHGNIWVHMYANPDIIGRESDRNGKVCVAAERATPAEFLLVELEVGAADKGSNTCPTGYKQIQNEKDCEAAGQYFQPTSSISVTTLSSADLPGGCLEQSLPTRYSLNIADPGGTGGNYGIYKRKACMKKKNTGG